jgi:hypothetical protein
MSAGLLNAPELAKAIPNFILQSSC